MVVPIIAQRLTFASVSQSFSSLSLFFTLHSRIARQSSRSSAAVILQLLNRIGGRIRIRIYD